jgi:hypothetical protein
MLALLGLFLLMILVVIVVLLIEGLAVLISFLPDIIAIMLIIGLAKFLLG